MDHLTLADLPALLTTLRAHGVADFSGFGVSVTLAPVSVPLADLSGALPSPAEAPERCPCGHSYATEHSEAGCLRGCSEALCSSKDAGPEPVE
jgi:hypothetical protein